MLQGTDNNNQSESTELKRFLIIIGWLENYRKRQP